MSEITKTSKMATIYLSHDVYTKILIYKIYLSCFNCFFLFFLMINDYENVGFAFNLSIKTGFRFSMEISYSFLQCLLLPEIPFASV